MVRMISLKTLLLFLMVIVVALTLIYIVRCSSSPGSSFNLNSLARKQSFAEDSEKLENDGGLSYYQFVNEEERAQSKNNYQAVENNGASSVIFKSKPKVQKLIKNSLKEENGVEGALDYPFEDDFDTNQNRNNQEKEKSSQDNLDVYALSTQNKDKSDSNALLRLKQSEIVDIVCDINNGKYKIGCKKDLGSSEVYIPFSFIHKYFEVYGKLEEPLEGKENEKQTFTWLHSQVKIHRPKIPYNPKGVFTYFENYNVEVRDRVKCISGSEGVPLSTQWDINGYFYPIQIAQFGLSHFSKYLTEGEPKRVILEDGGDEIRGGWIPSELVVTLPDDNNDPLINHFVQIQMPSSETVSQSVKLPISPTKTSTRLLVLSWHMKLMTSETQPNVTLTATLRYESQVFYLHYVTADYLIKAKENHIYHGLGFKTKSTWQHIIRDLGVDVQKGINFLHQNTKKSRIPKISKSKLTLESISLESFSISTLISLDNLTLSTNEHLAQFFQAADWFVTNQDPRGGWPIPVRRKFGPDFYPVLESGWYSAMGQGHALSLLSRAYSITSNNSLYAEACAKALENIFDNTGVEFGVRALFMEKYVWYEEYPTTPSSFVLNGFMYALLGLYDVKSIGVSMGAGDKAKELYDEGLKSLKAMLTLFDTGSGTMYDLRHVTVPGISPNLARVDYHVTHINQLLMFATFEKDPIFETTAERWIGYSEGNRAPHN